MWSTYDDGYPKFRSSRPFSMMGDMTQVRTITRLCASANGIARGQMQGGNAG
jgi:hypothetical protein